LNYKSSKTKADELIILGNGPSLNDTLIKGENFFPGKSFMVVNGFATSDIYEKMKPEYYIMADPQFWNDNNPVASANKICNDVRSAIISKTTWPLYFFLPYEAKKSGNIIKQFKTNKNIKIIWYNKTTVTGLTGLSKLLFRLRLGIPRPQNVLIPALIVTINMGFKKIYIAGTDHSWHEDLVVDNNNNVCYRKTHFYNNGTSELIIIKDIFTGKPIKLYQQFESLAITFRNYHIIEDYAATRNINICNISEKSYIDAFKRIEI
ncbi:MAG: hypothetical protein JXB34_02025, partial [Bacteroidales bacterium]|nr:hypothetical protein [Bacteroidales bacterium]